MITDIKLPKRSYSSKQGFPIKALVKVLLARPRSLMRIGLGDDQYRGFRELSDVTPALVKALFIQLAKAPDLQEIQLKCYDLVVPGALLCSIGERCTNLTHLELHVDFIAAPFDSPTAFGALEYIEFTCKRLLTMSKKKRDALEPPNFSHFAKLREAANMLWNENYALSLSNAPCLSSLAEGFTWDDDKAKVYLRNQELRRFFRLCKDKVVGTTLTSFSLTTTHNENLDTDDRPDDVTCIALLDAFPNAESIELSGTRLKFDEPLLTKLNTMKRMKHLFFGFNYDFFNGLTRTWLEASCHLFPKTLESLTLDYYSDPDEVVDDGLDRVFIRQSFQACLPRARTIDVEDLNA